MPDTFTTVVTSAITAVAVLPTVAFTIGPRLEARNRRIQDAHRAREECNRQLLTLGMACMRLEKTEPGPEIDEALSARLVGERERWRQQADSVTIYLMDQLETFATTYVDIADVRDILIKYSAMARLLWLADRPEIERVREIRELTEDVLAVYGGGPLAHLFHAKSGVAALTRLKAKLADAEAPREQLEA